MPLSSWTALIDEWVNQTHNKQKWSDCQISTHSVERVWEEGDSIIFAQSAGFFCFQLSASALKHGHLPLIVWYQCQNSKSLMQAFVTSCKRSKTLCKRSKLHASGQKLYASGQNFTQAVKTLYLQPKSQNFTARFWLRLFTWTLRILPYGVSNDGCFGNS